MSEPMAHKRCISCGKAFPHTHPGVIRGVYWACCAECNTNGPDDPDGIWNSVVEDMKARNDFGFKKYGVALKANDGRKTIQDLYEELLDACVYTKKLIKEQEISSKSLQLLKEFPENVDKASVMRWVAKKNYFLGVRHASS